MWPAVGTYMWSWAYAMADVGRSRSLLLPSLAIVLSAVLWGSLWIPLRQIAQAGLSSVWASLMVYGAPLFVMLPLIVLRRGRLGHFGLAALWVGATSGICNTFYA